MADSINVVIPVKGLLNGKSRLAGVLTVDERTALNRRLMERTVQIAVMLPGTTYVYVVSPDNAVENIARSGGANFLIQTTDGLNTGLAQAAAQISNDRTVYLPADLPRLTGNDIHPHMVADGIGISPDSRGQGTNVLSLPTPAAIPFQFGTDSFRLHCATAEKSGFCFQVIDRPGLAFDLDTEADLRRMEGWPQAFNPRNLSPGRRI